MAAWLATLGLSGIEVEGLDLPAGSAVPVRVALETDEAVDDINIVFANGGRLLAQVKRSVSLGSAPFSATVDQWVNAVRVDELDATRDRLALVTEANSPQIRALASALTRTRSTDPGRPTIAEQEAIRKLERLLSPLPDAQRELLLSVATVLIVQVSVDNASHRQSAMSMLDTSVVTTGQGPAAFEALKSRARNVARLRHGQVLDEWRSAIKAARLELRESLVGAPSARATALDTLVHEYRQRRSAAGRALDLVPLGIALRPIPLDDAGEIWRVRISSSVEERGDVPLSSAIRRRGRAVLLGPPGAGKSSALCSSRARGPPIQISPRPLSCR